MHLSPVLLTIWAILGASFLALLVYRGQLTRYEDEQLFLNDEVESQSHSDHEQIVSRLDRLNPAFRIFASATAIMTVSIVGIYVWNAWKTLR